MAQINLLPWREEMRLERKKEFLVQLFGVCLVGVLACFMWVKTVDASIDDQRSRNQRLQSEINILKSKVEEIERLKQQKKDLVSKMRVIQDLEGKRSIIVHYFDGLAKAIPDGVYFTSLNRRGQKFSLVGISENNQRISEFMRELDKNPWFDNPNLKSVVASPANGEQAARFDLEVDALEEIKKEDSEGGDNG
jgi:type IV pilus assembly protein PilN